MDTPIPGTDNVESAATTMDPLRGFVGFGFYLLILAFYWLIQTSYVLDRNVSRKDGKLRRWRFSCKSDNSRCTVGSSGSPASTVDSGLAVDRTPSCPASFWCVRAQRWPLEASFRFVLSLVAASCELTIAGLNSTFSYEDSQDAQRATFYGVMCLSGLIDLLCHFRLLYPAGSGHFVMSVAFATQAAFFYNNQQESLIACAAIVCLAAATMIEIWWDRTITSRLPRIYFSLVASSWLLHVGFRQLADQAYATTDSDTFTMSPSPATRYKGWTFLLFVWHVGGSVVVMLCFAAVTKCVKMLYSRANLSHSALLMATCCPCSSAEDEGFRASPTDDFEETEPLALHP